MAVTADRATERDWRMTGGSLAPESPAPHGRCVARWRAIVTGQTIVNGDVPMSLGTERPNRELWSRDSCGLAGTARGTPLEIIRSSQEGRLVLEEWRPLAESLQWELSRLYYES